ncbi:histidine phosphatase family protein [Phenylobacterium sp.]|jgi:broad specificity phosphatase PhoE|uniref:histidine phosphatase family protein n=1 Tax=Phenylobacterium sp. TaxID=1871053 RepID=UPI00120030F9|nr:histidine phosphatase family protein [Phenylobacterium sp.]THD55595.1 MAG: histidine phosphatase family protein [Phenylobacterium sp.]
MIYLIRHGQTEFNRERRIQGHVDSALTELGVRQAKAMGRLLRDLIRDSAGWRIVSSPLGRARSTAEIIADALKGPQVEFDDRLKEMSWGSHDGRLRAELETEHPETFGRTGWAFDAPTDGESYEDVQTRVGAWLAELPPEPERRIVAVSHGIAGRVLRGLYANLPRDEAGQQDVPQDAVFALLHGGVGRIDCEPMEQENPSLGQRR